MDSGAQVDATALVRSMDKLIHPNSGKRGKRAQTRGDAEMKHAELLFAFLLFSQKQGDH